MAAICVHLLTLNNPLNIISPVQMLQVTWHYLINIAQCLSVCLLYTASFKARQLWYDKATGWSPS